MPGSSARFPAMGDAAGQCWKRAVSPQGQWGQTSNYPASVECLAGYGVRDGAIRGYACEGHGAAVFTELSYSKSFRRSLKACRCAGLFCFYPSHPLLADLRGMRSRSRRCGQCLHLG
jgi:hypothetical protein